jgi:glyoxylase-like metal-dependent hydrolase (beta-lactamase superfamily II)
MDQVTSAIEGMLDALGGSTAVMSAGGQTVTATGWRRHPGWGTDPTKPELVAEFDYSLTEDAVRPRYRLDLSAKTYLVPTDLHYTETGDGSRGFVDGVDFMFNPQHVHTALPSWRVGARLRHLHITSPLRLARALVAPGADVTVPANDPTVLVLREAGSPPVRIRLDPATSLPTTLEVTEEHSPHGDAAVEVAFTDYRPTGDLVLPHHVTISIDGRQVHDETRTDITVIAQIDDTPFALPENTADVRDGTVEQLGYASYSNQWIMNYVLAGVPFYFDLQIAPVLPQPLDLGPGVKLVVGPSHNTLVVEMSDHVVTVEAPLYNAYARAALRQVTAAFPGKPLRKTIATHFHYDHIGGIREFAANGDLTVLVGSPSVPFFEEVLHSEHTVAPDRMAANPVPVNVEGIDDKLVLPTADGGTLEIHRITSDHSGDMSIVYLSKPKIVFESDLWNPTPTMPERGAQRGRLASQLYDAIVALGLDVETIVGGHGSGPVHSAPLAYLRTAADR